MKNNVYPLKLQFYYIKVGFKRVRNYYFFYYLFIYYNYYIHIIFLIFFPSFFSFFFPFLFFSFFLFFFLFFSPFLERIFEPAHDKTYKMVSGPSEDSDQPGHVRSMDSSGP